MRTAATRWPHLQGRRLFSGLTIVEIPYRDSEHGFSLLRDTRAIRDRMTGDPEYPVRIGHDRHRIAQRGGNFAVRQDVLHLPSSTHPKRLYAISGAPVPQN